MLAMGYVSVSLYFLVSAASFPPFSCLLSIATNNELNPTSKDNISSSYLLSAARSQFSSYLCKTQISILAQTAVQLAFLPLPSYSNVKIIYSICYRDSLETMNNEPTNLVKQFVGNLQHHEVVSSSCHSCHYC